jgi:phosphate starvation-inducible protein PhoH
MSHETESENVLSEQEQETHVFEKKTEKVKRRRSKKLLNFRDKIKDVSPKTPNQEQLFHSFFCDKHILLHGCAGTGKSYCALYLALNDLFSGRFDKIIILRSIVPTRDIGFLPGNLQEKIDIYEEPYQEIVNDLLGRKGAYDDLKRDEVLEFKSTSFLRGITWSNALIIADEIQNCTWHEICSLITRVGEGSRLIVLGDVEQNDLTQQRKNEKSGLESLIRVCHNMRNFDVVEFGVQDILRSELVKEFLTVKRNLGL